MTTTIDATAYQILYKLRADLDRAGEDVHADNVQRLARAVTPGTDHSLPLPEILTRLRAMRAPQCIRPRIEQAAADLAAAIPPPRRPVELVPETVVEIQQPKINAPDFPRPLDWWRRFLPTDPEYGWVDVHQGSDPDVILMAARPVNGWLPATDQDYALTRAGMRRREKTLADWVTKAGGGRLADAATVVEPSADQLKTMGRDPGLRDR